MGFATESVSCGGPFEEKAPEGLAHSMTLRDGGSRGKFSEILVLVRTRCMMVGKNKK
jgi:hypothetical protein